MAEIDLVPSLNSVSRDKKSASVRQADVPTNFNHLGNNLDYDTILSLSDMQSLEHRRYYSSLVLLTQMHEL